MLFGLPIKLVLLAFKTAEEIENESLAYRVWLCYLRMLVAASVKRTYFTSVDEYNAFVRLKNHRLPYHVRRIMRQVPALKNKVA